jgi:hypothetical protein
MVNVMTMEACDSKGEDKNNVSFRLSEELPRPMLNVKAEKACDSDKNEEVKVLPLEIEGLYGCERGL